MKAITVSDFTRCLLVPARKGSKRIKHKNLQGVGGLTLIEWSISLADDLAIPCILSTNDEKLRQYESDATILDRPDELCTDDCGRWEFLDYHHAMGDLNYDLICMHQCTSPFVMPETVQRCFELAAFTGKCVMTIAHDMTEIEATKTGAVYVIHRDMIFNKEYWSHLNWLFIAVDKYESMDIDTPEDLERARDMYEEMKRNESLHNG